MRKILSLFIIIALLLCLAPSVWAAGTAYWSGPDAVRAGDTITLTFYAGGGIYGGNGSVSYDPAVLTLQSYSPAIGGSWVVEFGGNRFVFYDNSMASPISGSAAIFRATFTVNAGVSPGTEVSVTASGVALSDGQQETGVGSPSYRATVAPPLSDNCDLESLSVSGATISPAFDPNTTNYTASVPFTVSSIGVTATAAHEGAQVSVNNPALTAGGVTAVTVTVTAENGAVKVYKINVTRARDPNYKPSSNKNLSELAAEGYSLSPAFSPEVTQYYLWLPYEAETVSLTAKTEDKKASFQIGECPELTPGAGTDIPVTVTAEDESQQVYTVTVIRAPAHDQLASFLAALQAPPEEPPTEPETEPTVPETEPTEPETVPAADPVPQGPAPEAPDMIPSLLTAAIGVGVGAAIMALISWLIRKKKA